MADPGPLYSAVDWGAKLGDVYLTGVLTPDSWCQFQGTAAFSFVGHGGLKGAVSDRKETFAKRSMQVLGIKMHIERGRATKSIQMSGTLV